MLLQSNSKQKGRGKDSRTLLNLDVTSECIYLKNTTICYRLSIVVNIHSILSYNHPPPPISPHLQCIHLQGHLILTLPPTHFFSSCNIHIFTLATIFKVDCGVISK